MIDYFESIDTEIFIFLNGLRAPFLDSFMMMFTERFIWVPLYFALLLMIFRGAGLKAGLLYTIFVIMAISLTDHLCAGIIRPVAERMRPSNIENPLSSITQIVDEYRGGPYGFPSCHAGNSFALALFMSLFYRRRAMAIFMISWAVLNSYTRIYLGVHYPGDILVGAFIGCFIGLFMYYIAYAINTRFRRSFGIATYSNSSDKSICKIITLNIEKPLLILYSKHGIKIGLNIFSVFLIVMIAIIIYIALKSTV